MRESKFLEIIRSLSKEELTGFGEFIRSRAFNTSRKMVLLYEFLRKNHSGIKQCDYSRERIFRSVYKNEKFNESKYWKLTSGFSSILERFLVYIEFKKDIFYRDNLLLENYRKRNLRNQFSQLSVQVAKNSRKEFNRSMNFFINQTHYYFQKISYFGFDNPKKAIKDAENLFENLRMFFLMTHLVSISIMSNFDKDFINYCRNNVWFFEEMLEYLDKNKSRIKKNYTTVYIFYLILYTKIYPNEENYYYELKELVLKNTALFSGNFLRHILVNILGYAVNKLAEGSEKFLREIFIINKIMAEKSLTFFGEYIQAEYFYSVVEHAAELNEIEWISEFIDKYKQYLRNDYKDTAVNLSQAKINFVKSEFGNSLECLLMVNNINPYFYISHKILLLQNYYETGNVNSIKYVMETLNKYLKRRSDINPDTARNCRKFVEYFRILQRNETKVKTAVEQLENEKYFMNKAWLLSKLTYQQNTLVKTIKDH